MGHNIWLIVTSEGIECHATEEVEQTKYVNCNVQETVAGLLKPILLAPQVPSSTATDKHVNTLPFAC